jgi:hypothetical protein
MQFRLFQRKKKNKPEDSAKDIVISTHIEAEEKETKQENVDQSVYSADPEATQEEDMEEDLALLDEDDDGW